MGVVTRWVSDCLCQVFTPNPIEYIIERASEQEREREREKARERERDDECLVATAEESLEESLGLHPLYQYA